MEEIGLNTANGLGYAIGLGGAILTIIAYARSRRERQPVWSIVATSPVVRPADAAGPDLVVLYDGERVETVSVTKLLLWNQGRLTMRGDDIATKDRLRVVPASSDVRILQATVIGETREPLGCRIWREQGAWLVGFDFLDHSDGLVAQVVHTGAASEDLEFRGTVMGGGELRRVDWPPRPSIAAIVMLALLAGTMLGTAALVASIVPPQWSTVAVLSSLVVAAWAGATVARRVQGWLPASGRTSIRDLAEV